MKRNYVNLQQAEKAALAELSAGFAVAFCTSWNPTQGCVIHLQSDQGWNPEPFWVQFEDSMLSGSNDSLTD